MTEEERSRQIFLTKETFSNGGEVELRHLQGSDEAGERSTLSSGKKKRKSSYGHLPGIVNNP